MSDDEDYEDKTILVIQTHGVDTPRRTYSPLFYAMASAAMEIDTTVWFTMEGTSQLRKGAAAQVQLDSTSEKNGLYFRFPAKMDTQA